MRSHARSNRVFISENVKRQQLFDCVMSWMCRSMILGIVALLSAYVYNDSIEGLEMALLREWMFCALKIGADDLIQ